MTHSLALLLVLAIAAGTARAQSEDAAHRADRKRTEQLNRGALQASAPRLSYRDQDMRDYRAARGRYERDLAAWRRRVAACRAGDWQACR